MKKKEKMKQFKSIHFVFLKFPVSNLFSASDLVFRISTDLVKKSVAIISDKPEVTVDKHGGILDKDGGVWDKHGGISDKLADTQNQQNPRFQLEIEENI